MKFLLQAVSLEESPYKFLCAGDGFHSLKRCQIVFILDIIHSHISEARVLAKAFHVHLKGIGGISIFVTVSGENGNTFTCPEGNLGTAAPFSFNSCIKSLHNSAVLP